MTQPQRRCLTAILAVALFVRLAWAIVQPRSAAALDGLPDQREYLTLADNLLHHSSLRLYDPRFAQSVVAYRLPGYPLFLDACGESVLLIRIIQAAVDTSTVFAVYLLARQLSGCVPGSIASAAFLAVNPSFVYFSSLILTETAFAAAVAWATVTACRRATPAAILLFVVAVYLRPTALLLAPVIGMLAAHAANSTVRRPYHWEYPFVIPISLLVALTPWAARNYLRLGVPVWTTTNDGITLYDGFHDGATGGSDQRFLAGLPGLRSMSEVKRSRDLSRRAWQWIVEHPKQLPSLSLRKVARGWSPVPLSQEFGRPLYRWIGGGYAVPFDLFCLIGLASPRLRRSSKLLLVTPAVVLTLVQVFTVGSIRYRMPAEASLAVLAGIGALDLWHAAKRVRRG